MKEAMERYGVSSGSLNSALAYGYSAGGYHFYRADEPKPDDSFFKSDNGGKGSSKKRPVICLETGVQFESAIAAVKWLDSGKTNNRGNMRAALISGSALLGYHFYYADEPKPPNSHFKRAVYCEDLDTVFTSLETCADAIGFNGSISDLADKVANGTVVKGHRLGFVSVDRKPLPNGDKWKPAVTDAKRENMQAGRTEPPAWDKQPVKSAKLQEWLETVCEYENSVAISDGERLTFRDSSGIIHLKGRGESTGTLKSYADRCNEYLRFGDEVDLAVCGAYSPYDALKVCDTPEIFLKTGFEQRPMLYTQKHLFQALTPKSDYNPHRHGFSIAQVKRFPELLASPVALANSPNRDDVVLAILLATDDYGAPLIAGIKPDGMGNYGECEVETNMVLSVYSRQNFIRYFALLRDMDAFVFVSGRKIDALEDLSGLPLAGNCSGLDIDRILQRPKCLG